MARTATAPKRTYTIDCSTPVGDGIMDVTALAQFLQDRIKVEGKTGVLGEHVKVVATKSKVQVTTSVPMAKRYLKYLTKKFLKKHQVRDWLRVLASNTQGERTTYELKYYKLNEENEDSKEEE